MNIGEYIKKRIKEEGRTSLWVAEKLNINYKTFVGKLNKNLLSSDELLKISVLLDINLEDMKNELDYSDFLMQSRKFVYIPINYDKEELLNEDEIPVIKMEVMNKKRNDKNVLVNILNEGFNNFEDIKKYKDIKVYAFEKCDNDEEYKLGEISINLLKYAKEEKYYGCITHACMVRNGKNDTYSLELLKAGEKRSAPRTSSSAPIDFCISSKEL